MTARRGRPAALAFVALSSVGVALGGCASGHCRHAEPPAGTEAKAPATGEAGKAMKDSGKQATGRPAASAATVLVYKPDGSLQCGMGKGLALEEMEKELGGIAVVARDKRSDGLMHIQACGQPTGMSNVYEIPEKSLPAAEKRGFRRLRPG